MEGLWSISGPVQLDTESPVARTAATFLRSCVAQALSRRDGSRHSLHASMYVASAVRISFSFSMTSLFILLIRLHIPCSSVQSANILRRSHGGERYLVDRMGKVAVLDLYHVRNYCHSVLETSFTIYDVI